MDFVPEKTAVVFKISNFDDLQADIENSSLLSKFENTAPYTFFSEKSELFQVLRPESQSLLCINKMNDSLSAFTFITKHTKNLFQIDSLKNRSIETLKLDKLSFQKIVAENETAYSAIIDSIFVISSSQQLLVDILKGKTERNDTFKKVFNLPSANKFTALIRGNKLALNDSTAINFTSWSALDVNIAPEAFTAIGISLATDTIPQLLNVFEGQVPQQNDMAELVPTDALGAISFTFNDAETFQQKLRRFRGEKDTVQTTGIFGSVSEAGSMQFKDESAIFIKSIDAALTNDALARFLTAKNKFREVEISEFSEPKLFRSTFSPFINEGIANFVFQLENFFVFTESESTAQQIISNYLNNNTLKNTSYFENTATDLSTASSLLILKMNGEFSEAISGFFNLRSREGIENISFNEFPLAALQFSFDRNFAHVTLSCKELGADTKTVSGVVSEKFSLSLNAKILNDPQAIEGKNGSSYAVVQDMNNKLYFISENGKILWTKELDSPILGTVKTANISGNIHLAFATKKALHLINSNGNEAKSFPINFKDEVTRPLSVFDYDNNRNYRFAVVQDKEVLLYDKNGKIVKGFGFNKTKSTIVQSPVHIRMGSKDYIVIAEESGKLNILSRVGKSRITVSKNFNFSEIPVAEEDNTFVVITEENTKERISQNGTVTSQKLDVGGNYWFAIHDNTKATLDGNLLRINGKLAELPLGIYTKPQIFSLSRDKYITITETQEKKVYVFEEDGSLIKGFPVYGSSPAYLVEGSGKNGITLVVKGEDDSILMYSK